MAIQIIPPVNSTVQIIHSGDRDGATFTTTLAAAQGGPTAPQTTFVFDLSTYAPDMVGLHPVIEITEFATGLEVYPDISVENDVITVVFGDEVIPNNYRIKAVG